MKEGTQRVPISEAARLLGQSEPCIRERMRRGCLPIGHAISPRQKGGRKWEFIIYRAMLNAYMGLPEEQKEAMIEAAKGEA